MEVTELRNGRHCCGNYRVSRLPRNRRVCRSMECYGIRPGADIQIHNVTKSGIILYIDGVRVALSHDVAGELGLCEKK
jgi:Fe2+ transport system protein FeoA